jgi:hypothetical protein
MRSRRSPVVGLIERKSYQARTATSPGGRCSVGAMPPLKIAVVLAVLLAIGTDTAVAATVRVDHLYEKAAYVGDRLYLQARAGETNDVTMLRQGSTVTVTDRVPLEPGAACEARSPYEVRCTVAEFGLVVAAKLEDGDDEASLAGVEAILAKLYGGPGDDHLVGLSGWQTWFTGGPGNDLMEGGAGADLFKEDAERNGSDTMIGGSPADPPPILSDDTVDYGLRRRPIHVRLDEARNDGERGERDRIGTDVERVVTGASADVLSGDGAANQLVGGAGRDLISGGGGDDYLVGDEYLGKRSARHEGDLIEGGRGDDRIEGGLGADRVIAGLGHDSIVAAQGADRLLTRDGVLDAVLCGTERDRVLHDGSDFLADDCERQGAHIPARVVPVFWADGGDRLFLVLGCPFHRGVTCQAEATFEVAGQAFGPRSFSLAPGRYAWLLMGLGERTRENREPPLDGGLIVLKSADARGRVATVRVPLGEVHRDPNEFSFFLPPVLPFL